MTHLPNNHNCVVYAQAKVRRKQNTKKVVVIDADTMPREAPAKLGDLIKSDDEDVDSDIPINTVAVVMLDRATQWIALCPTTSNTATHTP